MARVTQSPYGTTVGTKGQDRTMYDTSTAKGTYIGGMGGSSQKAGIPTWGGSLTSNAGSLLNKGVNNVITKTAPAISNAVANRNNSGGIGSGGGLGTGINALQSAYLAQQNNMMSAIMSALQAQRAAREQAVNAANAALDKQAGLARDRYNTSKQQLQADYQDLRNANSNSFFKARRAQREALADRGALDTGAGMQENIRMSANYTNGLNKINSQEATAAQNLLNNLNQILAQYDMQKANNMVAGLNGYNNNLASLINAAYSGYTPDAGYYGLAQQFANGQGYTPVQTNNAIGTSLYDTLLRQYGI